MTLEPDQAVRYARNVALPEIGEAGQARLLAARVTVIGAGGIGSPVVQYLAAAGIGRITLIDDDRVSLSNLQRQILFGTSDIDRKKVAAAADAVQRLNSGIVLVPIDAQINAGNASRLLADADVVVDGSDSFATRLAVSDAAMAARIPLVSAAVGQFDGQVGVFRGWEEGKPCYRCLVGDAVDRADASCADQGVLGALTGTIGCMAAIEAIRQIAPFGDDSVGKLMLFDARAFRTRTVSLPKNPDCSCRSPLRSRSSPGDEDLAAHERAAPGRLYHDRILQLGAEIPHARRLGDPEGSASKRSPICGSRITVDVILDPEGRIAALGQEVRACALGRASASLMARHAIGRSWKEMEAASAALAAGLAGERDDFGNWPGLDVFLPARAYPARHPSIRLAFEAVTEAAHVATRQQKAPPAA